VTPTEAAQFMTEIIAMWTNPDSHARRAVIQTHFHESIHFYSQGGEFIGYEGLVSFGEVIQRRFPGARFTLAQPPQMLGNAIRAYWHMGPPDKPQAGSGMDFVILQGDKVSLLYAFVG
jgi:hypothetical protein